MEEREVQAMFQRFNHKYFWGRLDAVKLAWSKNMTLCAGKTYCKERQGVTSCAIYLSLPLLTQRPREDTVNTLLHEMIHAYLFVTGGGKERRSHGPEFREHMNRINKLHGSKITVFHNFRKEVDKFRVHVYRCDGPCTKQRPYYGVLRRAITRPPGPTDRWWARHSQECGGTFHKVEGPDVTPDPAHDANKSVKTGSLGSPRTPSLKHTPSPRNTLAPKHTSSTRTVSFANHTPSPKTSPFQPNTPSHRPIPSLTSTSSPRAPYSGTSQSDRMAGKAPAGDSREAMSGARKRLKYDPNGNADMILSEDLLVNRIKKRHAHTSRSVLLSKEETKKIWRGNSPEKGTLVDGRVNYNYRPKFKSSLNVQKYLARYRAVKEAGRSKPQKAPVFQSPQASPAKPEPNHFPESDLRTKATHSSQSSRTKTDTNVNSRAGGSSSPAPAPPCVTCWNCGVNVMVPENVSQTEDSGTPQKASAPVKVEKLENSMASNLVPCPSCGEKVPEGEVNRHLDECLMPFTDDF